MRWFNHGQYRFFQPDFSDVIFNYKKGLYDKYYFVFKLNPDYVQKYIQTVLTQVTLYLFNFKCVCEPGNVEHTKDDFSGICYFAFFRFSDYDEIPMLES